MTDFTNNVLAVIRSIPEGKVMTYGQIAGCAGSPRAARQVVRILHAMSRKHRLPWHRVLNAKGEIAIADGEGADMQRFLLEAEGVQVSKSRTVRLDKYQFHPFGTPPDSTSIPAVN